MFSHAFGEKTFVKGLNKYLVARYIYTHNNEFVSTKVSKIILNTDHSLVQMKNTYFKLYPMPSKKTTTKILNTTLVTL